MWTSLYLLGKCRTTYYLIQAVFYELPPYIGGNGRKREGTGHRDREEPQVNIRKREELGHRDRGEPQVNIVPIQRGRTSEEALDL